MNLDPVILDLDLFFFLRGRIIPYLSQNTKPKYAFHFQGKILNRISKYQILPK